MYGNNETMPERALIVAAVPSGICRRRNRVSCPTLAIHKMQLSIVVVLQGEANLLEIVPTL